MEYLLVAAFVIIIIFFARLNFLYGRSAFECGEYGGPFIPSMFRSIPHEISLTNTKNM